MPPPPPTRLMPPVYLAASLLLIILLSWKMPGLRLWAPPYTWIGIPLIVFGFAVAMYCAWLFHRNQTTVRPFEESQALVTDGPYRFSRNPIYLSMTLLLVGVAILLGTATPWLVPPVFAYIMKGRYIDAEEAMLGNRFGGEYQQYCGRVRRWL